MSVRRIAMLVLSVAVHGLAVGCYSSTLTPPRTVPVSGSVVHRGGPVPGVLVKFHPQFDIGRVDFIPYGETGADGKFVLSTGASGNGAPQGTYKVTLERFYVGVDAKDGLEAEVDGLNGAYSDPNKSEWTVTIKSGSNVLDPFELK